MGNEPSIETVIEVVQAVVLDLPGKWPCVVMARRARAEFVLYDVDEVLAFRVEFVKLSKQGFRALGLVIWETDESGARSKRQLFPWLKDNRYISKHFAILCEEYAAKVKEEFERRGTN